MFTFILIVYGVFVTILLIMSVDSSDYTRGYTDGYDAGHNDGYYARVDEEEDYKFPNRKE